MDFYSHVVRTLTRDRLMQPTDKVLVVCGGEYDAETLRSCGFQDVTISNLDERSQDFGSFAWAKGDAECLQLEDASFDWTIVHGGLHHCASPHRALLEMYRVARKGVLAMEARDSWLMRLGVLLRMTPEYELEAVVLSGYALGGVRNSAVPNYIYRWTEREVRKTIESAYPQNEQDIRFFYWLLLPERRLRMSGPIKKLLAWALGLGALCIQRLFPKQGNRFGFAILKTGRFKPWIDPSGSKMRQDMPLSFDPSKYGN
jgi:SAM-dependent methyltransferase